MQSTRSQRIDMLRDQLLGGPIRTQATANAVLELAILMASADGDVSEREAEQIVEIVQQLSSGPFDGISLRDALAATRDGLAREGVEARIAAAAMQLRDPAERRQAFRIVASIALVDGWLDRAELRLFNQLARAFAITPEESGQIVTEMKRALFPDQ